MPVQQRSRPSPRRSCTMSRSPVGVLRPRRTCHDSPRACGRAAICTPASQYDRTVTWAQAAHASTDVDGLVWMSHRWNSSKSIVLFGDRVSRGDLAVEAGYRRVFAPPSDFDWLFDLCRTVGVSVAPPIV
jgi:RES domain